MTDKFSKNPNIIETFIDGVFFILDPDKHTYFTLNEVGIKMWRLFQPQAVTFKTLSEYLQEQYGLELSQCREHAGFFIESMVVKNILHWEKAEC